MNEIYNEFIFWLRGLIEDDPIPYEIKTLAFYVTSQNEIGFSGTESEEIELLDKFMFNPLEAQYFYCPKLYNYNNKLEVLSFLLNKLKKDDYFKKFNLYYGKLNFKAIKI